MWVFKKKNTENKKAKVTIAKEKKPQTKTITTKNTCCQMQAFLYRCNVKSYITKMDTSSKVEY